MHYDVEYIRAQFPALKVKVDGVPASYFDGPGGTQVPQRVIDAMVSYLTSSNANAGGYFQTSRQSDQVVSGARLAMADFFGSDANEVAFGQNTTTLIYQLAFALGRERRSRNEILITEIDHEANRGPWMALEERGFIIREARINTETCTLDMNDFMAKLSEKTLVAAFSYASNAVGTVSDVKEMVRLSHAAGALSVIDAVHYALHGPIDVKALDTDYLLCSAYKFFGPHLGVLYGKRSGFEKLPAYRLRVQSNQIPRRFETGTPNHEGIAGAGEAIEFIADIGAKFASLGKKTPDSSAAGLSMRRKQVVAGMEAMERYEKPLAQKLIDELSAIKKITAYGPPPGYPRTSTISFTVDGIPSDQVAAALGEKGLFVWDGHFYALRLIERLGLDQSGGLVRVGLSPYNTEAEIDRLLEEVKKITR